MKKLVLYIHGKDGSAAEADHYGPLFPDAEVIGLDYRAETPWEAKEEFPELFDTVCGDCDEVILIANSLGAYLALNSLAEKKISKAFFISPVVDMEGLILNMMEQAGITETELREKREITTSFGETLSWEYLTYVRDHPFSWKTATKILYGENDVMTGREAITAFADRIGADLTIMPNGEHWFHTEDQMRFLDNWLRDIND